MLLIDRNEMRVAFKHKDKAVCESQRVNGKIYVIVDETDESTFKVLTILEQKLLYHNMGQVLGTVLTNGPSVRQAIMKLARYHRDNVPNDAALPLYNAVTTSAVTKTAQGVLATTMDKAAEVGLAPKGNTSKLIWDVADELWAKAGSPKDPKEVLALRKVIMTELETNYHVKRNTSSNELGKWSKARI